MRVVIDVMQPVLDIDAEPGSWRWEGAKPLVDALDNDYKFGTFAAACPRCNGTYWLCEAHPDKPFEHDGCPGPGDPCPDCNELARK